MRILVLFLFALIAIQCTSKLPTTAADQVVYLVRHAEKADDGTKDPDLTKDGISRANNLANLLKKENIKAIFSTDYKRTQQTASPLANKLNLAIQHYDPRTFQEVMDYLMTHPNENILVVGHSNSTPTLANMISKETSFNQIDESDYTNLFKLSKLKGSWKSEILKY